MTDTVNERPTLGTAIHAITKKWGWFITLGIAELILGVIASTDLLAASLTSALIIGAMMLVAGVTQIIHGFSVRGLRGSLFWLFSGIVYAAAGAIVLYDPVLASLSLSLWAGVFLVAAGLMRVWAGFHMRPAAGWGWIVAAGALTVCVGGIVIASWPAIGLWFLGAMLVVDLIVQGWGFIAFGLALKARSSRHSAEPATV